MIGKRLILLLFVFVNVQISHATIWYDYQYEFPYFRYNARQLMGSEGRVPDMFTVAVKMNTYVKQKIDDGTLKNKPVRYTIYDLDNTNITRKRFCIEIYETPNAYYINVNWGLHFIVYFDYDELVKVIDYFAYPDFEPFYCSILSEDNLPLSWDSSPANLAVEILFNRINPLIDAVPRNQDENKTYDVYVVDSLKIQYVDGQFRVKWGDEDLGMALKHPISIPVKFRDRVIFADDDYLYVFENKNNIKKIKTRWLLSEYIADGKSTKLNIQIYSEWLNICKYDDTPIYSYSYKKNRFYEL